MTVFGKILVFLNLLFSVVTGALIVFVFTTRSNWVAAYTDAKTKAEAAEAAYRTEKASHEADRKQAEQTLATVGEQMALLDKQLGALRADNEQLQRTAATQTNLNNTSASNSQRLQAELDQNRSERTALVEERNNLQTRIVNMQKEVDDWRSTAIRADLQAKNLVQRVNNLLRQVEDLTARTRELEAAAPGASATARGTGSVADQPATAAPPGVKGKVTGASEGTGFAQVNIGSDSGLSAGNVLIVFRGSEYLGDLTITVAEPKTAVGKFQPKSRAAKIQAGDSVITSFTGAQ
jgi:hypothetical protein